MRLIAHLSDLHFGRVDPAIPPALTAALAEARPHLVVVSGDLTQRARESEFRDARRFLAALPQPQIVVPGNHDVPLHNLLARWLTPLTRFRRHITGDLEPFYADAEMAVLGINTARANTFKNGRINAGQIVRSCGRFAVCGPAVTRIVVTHHPFDLPESADEASLVGRARMAMAGFAGSRVDVVLSGHLHGGSAGDSVARYGASSRAVLLVRAGTAASTRRRGEVNSFNFLRVAGARVRVERMAWDSAREIFASARTDVFERAGDAWARVRESGGGVRPGVRP